MRSSTDNNWYEGAGDRKNASFRCEVPLKSAFMCGKKGNPTLENEIVGNKSGQLETQDAEEAIKIETSD